VNQLNKKKPAAKERMNCFTALIGNIMRLGKFDQEIIIIHLDRTRLPYITPGPGIICRAKTFEENLTILWDQKPAEFKQKVQASFGDRYRQLSRHTPRATYFWLLAMLFLILLSVRISSFLYKTALQKMPRIYILSNRHLFKWLQDREF